MIEKGGSWLGGRIVAGLGDICGFDGDAIVNAANSSILGGGGVDGAIHRAAGPELLAECRELRRTKLAGGLPSGQAVLTGAGRLPLKGIIHTVGPVWHGGSRGEAALLESAYRSSLALASEAGFTSIAFPAISTGVYGYPFEEAERIAFRAVGEFLGCHSLPGTVWLVFFSQADFNAFSAAAAE